MISALLRVSKRCSFTLLMHPDIEPLSGAAVIPVGSGGHDGSQPRPLFQALALARTIARTPADLWFFPSPLHFVPVITRSPVVVAIHDTIPRSYPRLIFPSSIQRAAWRIKLRLAVLQASHVVTVSDFALQSVARHFRLSAESISVVGEAPAPIFKPLADAAEVTAVSGRLGIPTQARMIIYHGALSPHKNLPTLVRAFGRLRQEPAFRDLHLVMVGSPGKSDGPAFQRLQDLCRGIQQVKLPGALDDRSLVLALNRATLAVLPSLEEGFGLTGLEAAACGTPLVATRLSALPEVLGDAAVYFEPLDEEALYGHMASLLTDPARRLAMRERGLARAASLTWDNQATRLMDVFESVLDPSGRAHGLPGRSPRGNN
jgi:glycosyltransferase involved in cell wall biosynthesis